MRQTFAAVITEHVQPLGVAIEQKRTERVQAVAEVHEQFIGLRDEFPAFAATSDSRARDARHDDARTDEIVIVGFGLKSKDGAIAMVEKVITGKACNPKILQTE